MIVMTVVIVNKVNDSGDNNDGPCIFMTDDSDDINDDDNDMLTSSMGPLSPRQ